MIQYLPKQIRTRLRALKHSLLNFIEPGRKSRSELQFWKDELLRYEQWYAGALDRLYQTPHPNNSEKIVMHSVVEASVLTWHKLHQEKKYLSDLELETNAFAGKLILDVGSGPIPSATCFSEAEIYCLDPLLSQYVEAGFPTSCYQKVHFVEGCSEKMPFDDHFFDVVLCVNSIDHVDNIEKTSSEIARVLKPGGVIRMHVHYHRSTVTEPLELNDKKMADLFSWCKGFRKLATHPHSHTAPAFEGEEFALWANDAPIKA